MDCRVNKQVQNYFKSLKNSTKGEEKFSFSRGLRLILACTTSNCLCSILRKSVPFGKYWRKSLLAFSTAPFCPEQKGSAKYTVAPMCLASHSWFMNTLPLSVVIITKSISQSPKRVPSASTGRRCMDMRLGMSVRPDDLRFRHLCRRYFILCRQCLLSSSVPSARIS